MKFVNYRYLDTIITAPSWATYSRWQYRALLLPDKLYWPQKTYPKTGIAVSVHTEGAPLPEYSVQKQSRVSRVNTYIPVPKPKIPPNSDKLEPSKFAISITLLTPGLPVPYSQPKPTSDNPYPRSQIVAGLPGLSGSKGNTAGTISPYIPITKSENETIAAYIYFDGRKKEEVATLLRPGEETWVNSRWVQVPESEGGGLAEREFLFREVGLERWLNGLDLDGRDAAAKIEKRRQNFEMRRRRRKMETNSDEGEVTLSSPIKNTETRGILRYGDDERSPLEQISDDEFSLSSDPDDEGPPESAGQIKVAMFRVLASGEIKKGEYSPQFGAHDDEDEEPRRSSPEERGVDHTTSFAKPKILDPKSVSTQTVTGIDGPDKPFAVFTFFYRGERQLQKMGITSPKNKKKSLGSSKRRSTQLDFSNLAPLKPMGTVGFSTFRESKQNSTRSNTKSKSDGVVTGSTLEDSDEEDDDTEILEKIADTEDTNTRSLLSPEDLIYAGEIADGVGRIKLKRQHSAEPFNIKSRKSAGSIEDKAADTTLSTDSESKNDVFNGPHCITSGSSLPEDSTIRSPLKKHRASVHDVEINHILKRLSNDFTSLDNNILAVIDSTQGATTLSDEKMEEEL